MARIALVDDDRNILTSVKMTLEGEGFEIDTYSDGQCALEAFHRKQPDVVVLDIKMSRMDGIDLLQKMRPKISSPVIFLTSKDDEIDEVLGLRMGADDYIKKPFSQRLLVARIQALLRRKAQFSDSLETGEKERHLLERGFDDGSDAPRCHLEEKRSLLDCHRVPFVTGFGATAWVCEKSRPIDGCGL